MPDYIAGSEVLALDYMDPVYASSDTLIDDVTSTTYIAGSPTVQATFIAPSSGRVMLVIGGGARSPARIMMALLVTEGASASDPFEITATVVGNGWTQTPDSASYQHGSRITMLEGLKPGQQYFVQHRYRSIDGTTGDINNRNIIAVPIP